MQPSKLSSQTSQTVIRFVIIYKYLQLENITTSSYFQLFYVHIHLISNGNSIRHHLYYHRNSGYYNFTTKVYYQINYCISFDDQAMKLITQRTTQGTQKHKIFPLWKDMQRSLFYGRVIFNEQLVRTKIQQSVRILSTKNDTAHFDIPTKSKKKCCK